MSQTQETSPKLKGGNHVLVIDNLKLFRGQFGLTFVAEMTVESTVGNPMVEAGQQVAWSRTGLDDAKPVDRNRNMGQVKSFFAAMLGLDPKQPPSHGQNWDQIMNEAILNDGEPCRGMRLADTATDTQSRAGNPFTKHAWRTA